MKSLLVTRPQEDSITIKEILTKLGFNIYIEPMFSIKYLPTKLNLEHFDSIISTSKHSIIALSKITKNRTQPIITVGDNTKQVAEKLGFLSVTSLNGNIYNIISYIQNNIKLRFLYIRGQEVTYNLKDTFNNNNMIFHEVILYSTIDRQSLSKHCYNALFHNKISAILFYSSRTASIFINLIKKHNIAHKTSNIIVYAMSDKIAEAVNNVSWKSIKISDKPTNKSLISLISSDIKNCEKN
ncbi:uroporphyrinogen-III synthase [Ehrlichia ruminantium]|uniref:Uroporphyrinogen-III synthase n=1 Tax=Ehrlichia ruminantium TaxID=779 RepID=A0AAE6UIK7_EHRRU|nr:uroporphyrinogen-III synthase [Ehrlichia ruminantium]QGR02602.1 uroporphyrinogen-III synthase [Ehrlichia ruminantium]QGR03522.1 uroporphyrinogen-III synthase [Ehrlichia ruminantium]QGR04449.1 uroporphyrinogen-III synthase [Ehrlichia ruminantium]